MTFDEAGQELRFNREILSTTLENISAGVSVVDPAMRLTAWNRRYQQMFGYPDGMLYVGRPVADHPLQPSAAAAARWHRPPHRAAPAWPARAKTRFLAHDVLQPLNAARLFASALRDAHQNEEQRHLAERVDELDAGGLPRPKGRGCAPAAASSLGRGRTSTSSIFLATGTRNRGAACAGIDDTPAPQAPPLCVHVPAGAEPAAPAAGLLVRGLNRFRLLVERPLRARTRAGWGRCFCQRTAHVGTPKQHPSYKKLTSA
ncbi:PAS-domain containing protein [Pantoea ananatis]|uniref:PAS-domain containing protein n=1 Tax=Pantoea ananas TaxID=553 RepID=UPI00221F99DE|nr:PAS-domain containing protein [Pantoea ananatis]